MFNDGQLKTTVDLEIYQFLSNNSFEMTMYIFVYILLSTDKGFMSMKISLINGEK